MRLYAESTSVPVSRSRGEIDRLLRDWGAKGLQWSDDFERGVVMLRFLWHFDGQDYMARFSLHIPTHAELKKEAVLKNGKFSESKMQKLQNDVGKREHRLLLLFLKAALNAVQDGLIPAEVLFLPFLEGKDGQTVAEIAIPRMKGLLAGSASLLLGSGIERDR